MNKRLRNAQGLTRCPIETLYENHDHPVEVSCMILGKVPLVVAGCDNHEREEPGKVLPLFTLRALRYLGARDYAVRLLCC